MLGKFVFYFKHSVNDLKSNGRRTLFALLCIAAGVAAIVSLQTLGVMIEDTLTGSLRESNRGDIRIVPSPGFAGDEANFSESTRRRDGIVESEDSEDFGWQFTPEGQEKLKQWFADNYEGDIDFTYQQALASNAAISISVPARDSDKGIVQPYFIEAEQYPLFGEIRTEDDKLLSDVLQAPTDIVISRNLADDLGAELGDKIRLSRATEDFTLRGIVSTDAEGGFENILGAIFGYYYVDVSAAQLFEDLTPGQATVIYVGLDNPDRVEEVDNAFRRRYPYLGTVTTVELEERNSKISNTVNELVIIMGLVSILIGGIGIVNTMLVIVSRRTVEVAVLKTIGLEPEQVTILFLIEAILMGIAGGFLGILLGWAMAFGLKGVAGTFVAQSLAFRVAPEPALNGFIVGVFITAVFGFLPTLAAGQVRPATVLRPSETIIPRSGRLQSFAALMLVLAAISLVAQGLIGNLLDFGDEFQLITGANGAIIGVLMSIPIVLGGFLDMRKGRKSRSWPFRLLLIWPGLLVLSLVGGFAFGYFVTSIIVVSVTFILVGSLYLLLLLLIWAVGGGSLSEFPVLGGLPSVLRVLAFIFFPLWTAFIVFFVVVLKPPTIALGIFSLFFFIHIPALIVTLVLPAWVLGQLLQRYGFLDLKISLRAMVAAKGRGASMLLALVIGIFTLSAITMMVDSILNIFDELLVDQIGGNVLIFPAGGEDTLAQVENVLENHQGVKSYSVIRNYEATFVSLVDVSANETLKWNDLEERILSKERVGDMGEDLVDQLDFSFSSVDARRLDANLPDVKLYKGRQLDPQTDTGPDADGNWPIVISATQATIDAGIDVGDLITFSIGDRRTDRITFHIVGMLDKRGGSVSGIGSDNYTLIDSFGSLEPTEVFGVADIEESQIRSVRRELAEIPGVFVLETRLLNELITSVIDQFTSFPILVAALALFTGGIVIANAVALSTMERRREIGIMKAIGLQRERVLGMLLLENSLMGLIGGLIGVGIGVLLLAGALVFVFEGELGNTIPYGTAFMLMGLCILIALGAAIVSVWGASGEKPLNVLRYE